MQWSLSFILGTVFFLSLVSTSYAKHELSANTFQVTDEGSQQKDPIVYKNKIVYTNFGGSKGIDIWVYDLKKKQNAPVIEKDGQQFLTAFFKNFIVYDEFDEGAQLYRVRLYDLQKKTDTLIAGGANSNSGGVTNGKYVVYIEGGACGQVHAYSVRKKTDEIISPIGCGPLRISEDIVVWTYSAANGSNIYGYDLKKKQNLNIVEDDGFQESPNIFENNVVYLEYTTGAIGDPNSIKIKNIKTGHTRTIYESNTSVMQWPAISQKYVVWSESSVVNTNMVKVASLWTSEIEELIPSGPHQNSHTTPSIWENVASWMSWRSGNGDIYASEIN